MIGKIVLADIYFTDFGAFKRRPILLFQKYENQDYLYCPLTTNLNRNGLNLRSVDLKQQALREPSLVLIPKIGTVHEKRVVQVIEEVSAGFFKKLHKEICKSLNCC